MSLSLGFIVRNSAEQDLFWSGIANPADLRAAAGLTVDNDASGRAGEEEEEVEKDEEKEEDGDGDGDEIKRGRGDREEAEERGSAAEEK